MKPASKKALKLNKKTVIHLYNVPRLNLMGGKLNNDSVVDSRRICDTTHTQVCSVVKACVA